MIQTIITAPAGIQKKPIQNKSSHTMKCCPSTIMRSATHLKSALEMQARKKDKN